MKALDFKHVAEGASAIVDCIDKLWKRREKSEQEKRIEELERQVRELKEERNAKP